MHTRIHDAISKLAVAPNAGRIVPELRSGGLDAYREIDIIQRWRVVFRLRGRRAILLAVLDGQRDLSELLLQRTLDDVDD